MPKLGMFLTLQPQNQNSSHLACKCFKHTCFVGVLLKFQRNPGSHWHTMTAYHHHQGSPLNHSNS
jgi:hypothetical protein